MRLPISDQDAVRLLNVSRSVTLKNSKNVK